MLPSTLEIAISYSVNRYHASYVLIVKSNYLVIHFTVVGKEVDEVLCPSIFSFCLLEYSKDV